MLILLCVIGAVILGIGIFVYAKYGDKLYRNDKYWIYNLLNGVGSVILCTSLIVLIIVGIFYSSCITIDDKIEIYKKENAKIEDQMSIIVENYMEYESETFEKFKHEDSVTLVSLYPELKSNELVAKQIGVYIANTEEIKRLECERLQYKVYAWWLFFGK